MATTRTVKAKLTEHLRELHLPTFRECFEEAAQRAQQETLSYEQYLLELSNRECEARRANRIERMLRQSKLPLEKTLEHFDLKRLPAKVSRQVRTLLDGGFLERCETSWLSAKAEREKRNHHKTPLVTELVSGSISVTDPTHPLYLREFHIAGIARLPGFRRFYQIEIFPDEYTYIPIDSTDQSTFVRPPSSLLTLESIGALVDTFRHIHAGRKQDATATNYSGSNLEETSARASSSNGKADRANSGGGNKS